MAKEIHFDFIHGKKKSFSYIKKQKSTKFIVLSVLGAVVGILIFLFILKSMNRVCFEKGMFDKCVIVDLAVTEAEKANGLMFRETLPEYKGMLFINEHISRRCIWMKNMNFPIDIIWLDINNNILAFEKNVPPCVGECEVYCYMPAKHIIEVSSGFVDKYSLKLGDHVRILLKN